MPNYSVFRPSPSDYWNKKEKLRPPSSIVKVLYRCLIADSGSRWLKADVCSKKKKKRGKKEQAPGPCFVIVWSRSRSEQQSVQVHYSGVEHPVFFFFVCSAHGWLGLRLYHCNNNPTCWPDMQKWQTQNRKVLLWLKLFSFKHGKWCGPPDQ